MEVKESALAVTAKKVRIWLKVTRTLLDGGASDRVFQLSGSSSREEVLLSDKLSDAVSRPVSHGIRGIPRSMGSRVLDYTHIRVVTVDGNLRLRCVK